LKKIVYRQRGAFHPKGDIQAIGACLEEIRQETPTDDYPNGEAPVEVIIERARDRDSPLHPNFTWDQSEAAHKYNLIEARRLWTSYEIVEISRNPGITDVERVIASPANVSVFMEDGTRRYVAAADAMTDKENEIQLLRDCEAQIQGLVKRLKNLKMLTVPEEVFDDLGKAADSLAGVARNAERKAKTRKKQPVH
jgi:hypothetical protein